MSKPNPIYGYSSLPNLETTKALWQDFIQVVKVLPELADLRDKLFELERKLNEQFLFLEQHKKITKEEILAFSFEVRTGHDTRSSRPDSLFGDEVKFIVCLSFCPRIAGIELRQHSMVLTLQDGYVMIENFTFKNYILGFGETEDIAWEVAIQNWSSPATRRALYGLIQN